MNPAGMLAEGLGKLGLEVAPAEQERLLAFLAELQRWAAKINLTAIREPVEGVEKHLLDSLTLLPCLAGNETVLDLGSGAGLPGIPLKLVCPGLELVSVDASEKKCLFQRHALRSLGLAAEVRHARSEALAVQNEFRGRFEVVIARAFASLDALLDHAEPFLADDGRVLGMEGAEGRREWEDSAAIRGAWTCRELRSVTLPFSGAQRHILVLARKNAHH